MILPTTITARLRSLGDDKEPFGVARLVYYAALIPISATAFRVFGDLTLSDWMFFVALAAVIVELTATQGKNVRGLPWLLIFGVAAFAAGGLLSSTRAGHPLSSIEVLAKFMYLTLVWFWLGVMVLRTLQHVFIAVVLWVVSAGLAGLAAIAQAIWGYGVIPQFLAGPNFAVAGAGFREAGITLHPNDLGSITAFALIPCLVLLTRSRYVAMAITYTTCLIAMLGGLVLSGSVGGFVAAIVGVAGWVVVFRSIPRHLLLLGVAAAVGVVFVLVAPQALGFASPLHRISQVTASNSKSSLNSRLELDDSTITVMIHRPLVGVGLDVMSQSKWVASPPENMFLLAWLGGGLFALIGLLVIVIACLLEGWRAIRAAERPEQQYLGAALLLSYGSTLIFALASPVLQQRYIWVSAAFLLAIRAMQRSAAIKGVAERPTLEVEVAAGDD